MNRQWFMHKNKQWHQTRTMAFAKRLCISIASCRLTTVAPTCLRLLSLQREVHTLQFEYTCWKTVHVPAAAVGPVTIAAL